MNCKLLYVNILTGILLLVFVISCKKDRSHAQASAAVDNTTDGVTRTGKIDISLNGIMTVANNVATMKIENYIVDGK